MAYLVETSYKKEDVTILLKDITGQVKPLDTLEREKLNQSGIHYSEMLPLEYKPSQEYMQIYNESLKEHSQKTAEAIAVLSEKIYKKLGDRAVLVSLARAGTPIGILIKRYLKEKYDIEIPHYSISIIRGKGIDTNAMNFIAKKHSPKYIQFVDGWTGKGAINNVLKQACSELKQNSEIYKELDDSLAVVSDPAFLTELCGTHEDFLIPSSCLNSTVSGLISRTFQRDDIILEGDFHGAVYYGELKSEDKSNEFLDEISKYFNKIDVKNLNKQTKLREDGMVGLDEVKKIASDFNIQDVNKVKPGVGETTRVLLRRVPYKVLVRDIKDTKGIEHIFRLCEEKEVEIVEYPLKMYRVCGIIKDISDL